MSADPQRFARIVLEAFEAAGHRTDAEVGRVHGPSTSTMTKLRKVAKGDEVMSTPKEPTWSAIDRAAEWPEGTARRVWAGATPEVTVRPIGDPEDDLVEFTVVGNFGVRAVVKGPIRNLDALQASVSKLIAGMQVDESNTRAIP